MPLPASSGEQDTDTPAGGPRYSCSQGKECTQPDAKTWVGTPALGLAPPSGLPSYTVKAKGALSWAF